MLRYIKLMNNTFVSKNKSKSRWGNLPETSDVEEKGNRFISKDKREERKDDNQGNRFKYESKRKKKKEEKKEFDLEKELKGGAFPSLG